MGSHVGERVPSTLLGTLAQSPNAEWGYLEHLLKEKVAPDFPWGRGTRFARRAAQTSAGARSPPRGGAAWVPGSRARPEAHRLPERDQPVCWWSGPRGRGLE